MGNIQKGILLVLSGPSGVGKGTICKALLKNKKDLVYSVSATTRKPRPGEINGKDYFFFSQEEFKRAIKNDDFLEWAKVYDNYYGTPKEYVDDIVNQGKDCILEIDVQGAMQVKEKKPDAVFIFVVPPSGEELLRRINCRGTENEKEIHKRMSQVKEEMALISNYNYMVVNDDVILAMEKVKAILIAEKCRLQNNCE